MHLRVEHGVPRKPELIAEHADENRRNGSRGAEAEHNEDLVAYGLDGTGTRDNHAGHHPWQLDESDCFHRVKGRDHARFDGALQHHMHGLASSGSQTQQCFNFPTRGFNFSVHMREKKARDDHRAAYNHAAHRNEVLRRGRDKPEYNQQSQRDDLCYRK